jgi:iron complex outermembrane recepter protein
MPGYCFCENDAGLKRRVGELKGYGVRVLALSVLAMLVYGVVGEPARAQSPERTLFDIQAGTLSQALQKLMEQSGLNVLSRQDHIEGVVSAGVKGLFTREEVLHLLTAHTNLCFLFDADHTSVTVDWCSTLRPRTEPAPDSALPPIPDSNTKAEAPVEASTAGELQSVTVTGSNIAHPALELPTGPPPIIVTREELLLQGIVSLLDLEHIFTQLFGGGPSQDTHLIGAETRTNTGLGAAYNIRALGARATVLLVNGRRVASSGSTGSFYDFLGVPFGAVKRVEFLTQGMSAIYGADAVAGVVNIITQDSDDPGETLVEAKSVTQGAWQATSVSQSWSSRWRAEEWGTGGAFGNFGYSSNTSLPADDRGFSNSDLRSAGGYNLDPVPSWPPNIVVGKQTFAAPQGLGVGVPQTFQLQSAMPNLDNFHSNSDLWPAQKTSSAYGQVRQSVGSHLTLKAEGYVTDRTATESDGGDRENIILYPGTPYYIPAIGQGAPLTVETDLFGALGPKVTHVEVQTIYQALVLGIPLSPDNSFTVSANRALETEHQHTTGIANATALTNPSVGYDPFVIPSALPTQTLTDIRGESFFNQSSELHQFSAQWSGPLNGYGTDFDPNAEKAMGAAGVEYRSQTLSTFDSTLSAPYDRYNRRTKAAYVELTVPVLGSGKEGDGQSLELSGAGRYEDYSDFGHTAVPRFALRWTLCAELQILASLGRSIRTPNLPDLNTSRNTVTLGPLPSGTGEVIYLTGNDPDLREEHATNAALEAIWTRDLSDASTLSLDTQLFSVDYSRRIQGLDLSSVGSDLLTNPIYTGLVTSNPSAAEVAQLCQSPQLYKATASQCLAGSYLAVVDLRLKNSDTLLTQGVDFRATWNTRLSWSTVDLKWIGTYLFRYADRSTPKGYLQPLLDTQNNPIDLQTHVSADVTSHGFGADMTVSFSDSYHDTVSQPNRSVASWTTIDLRIQYTLRPEGNSVEDNWFIGLGVENVTNRNPPFLINSIERLGYDEENANPLGRVLSLRVRKKW